MDKGNIFKNKLIKTKGRYENFIRN
jgi:hypothetical protein